MLCHELGIGQKVSGKEVHQKELRSRESTGLSPSDKSRVPDGGLRSEEGSSAFVEVVL